MNALTASRIVEAVLAVAAVFVSVRSKRHRPFAVWISLSLAYSILDVAWIQPVLATLPRPFTGAARIGMHASQALYLAVPCGFAYITFDLVRVPRWLRPLPAVVWLVTMFLLVDGYRHSPGPGLYRIFGSVVFRSRSVFDVIHVIADALVIGALAATGRSLYVESRGTDDLAILGTVVAMEITGVSRYLLTRTSLDAYPSLVPLMMMAGYVAALGFHAPVVVLHTLGAKSARFVDRQVRAMRREAIFEMGWRLPDSRVAVRRLFDGRGVSASAFPTASPIAARTGRTAELVALASSRPLIAAAVELVLSTVIGLGMERAAVLLRDIESAVIDDAPSGSDRKEETLPWLEIAQGMVGSPEHAFLAPLILPVFASMRDMTWEEAMETLAASRRVLARA